MKEQKESKYYKWPKEKKFKLHVETTKEGLIRLIPIVTKKEFILKGLKDARIN